MLITLCLTKRNLTMIMLIFSPLFKSHFHTCINCCIFSLIVGVIYQYTISYTMYLIMGCNYSFSRGKSMCTVFQRGRTKLEVQEWSRMMLNVETSNPKIGLVDHTYSGYCFSHGCKSSFDDLSLKMLIFFIAQYIQIIQDVLCTNG
jgi:hypothetical protein